MNDTLQERLRELIAKWPHDTSTGPHIGYQITYCHRCQIDALLAEASAAPPLLDALCRAALASRKGGGQP